MKIQIFAIFDSAAKIFERPFTALTIEEALRSFRGLVNDRDSKINRYPDDFSLFHLGEYDQSTGTIVPNNTPHSLGVAITFLEYVRTDGEPGVHLEARPVADNGVPAEAVQALQEAMNDA